MSSTGGNTPHSMLEKLLGSPRKAGSPKKPGGSPTKLSPEKARNPRFPKTQEPTNNDKVATKGECLFYYSVITCIITSMFRLSFNCKTSRGINLGIHNIYLTIFSMP